MKDLAPRTYSRLRDGSHSRIADVWNITLSSLSHERARASATNQSLAAEVESDVHSFAKAFRKIADELRDPKKYKLSIVHRSFLNKSISLIT